MAANRFRVQRNRKNDITCKLDDSSRTNRNVNSKHFLVRPFLFLTSRRKMTQVSRRDDTKSISDRC